MALRDLRLECPNQGQLASSPENIRLCQKVSANAELFDLPNELLYSIFELFALRENAANLAKGDPDNAGEGHGKGEVGVRTLLNLCLTSKKLYEVASALLYRVVEIREGQGWPRGDAPVLFLRTLVEHPHKRSAVWHLRLCANDGSEKTLSERDSGGIPSDRLTCQLWNTYGIMDSWAKHSRSFRPSSAPIQPDETTTTKVLKLAGLMISKEEVGVVQMWGQTPGDYSRMDVHKLESKILSAILCFTSELRSLRINWGMPFSHDERVTEHFVLEDVLAEAAKGESIEKPLQRLRYLEVRRHWKSAPFNRTPRGAHDVDWTKCYVGAIFGAFSKVPELHREFFGPGCRCCDEARRPSWGGR